MKKEVERIAPESSITNQERLSDFPNDLYDFSRVRGLYNPLHFVVRLRPEMYRLLEAEGEVLMASQIEPSRLDAFSNNPSLLTSISKCSGAEYNEVSTRLCKSMVCATPVEISAELLKWLEASVTLQDLLKQDERAQYSYENLPLRICFAKHLHYAQDRVRRPDFFCWPAMFMADHGLWHVDSGESGELFGRHQPPFMATLNGEIRPTLFEGRSIERTQQVGDEFYNWLVQYDLVDQWIVRDGPFDLDFRALNPAYTPDGIKPTVDRTFKESWGVSLDDFTHVV